MGNDETPGITWRLGWGEGVGRGSMEGGWLWMEASDGGLIIMVAMD